MISVNNLRFSIDQKNIINDISFNVPDGKIIGIIGPNGVGKTTLLRCLCGIYKIESGLIKYDGKDVYDNPEVKSQIGYVADENIMPLTFKVQDMVKYYKMAYKSFSEEKFDEINKVFKIPKNRYLFQLSKGMKMRLSLMLSLSINSKYLVLDEPTSGLDAILKKKLIAMLMKEVCDNNKTIVISSHHLDELERICDNVIILEDGKVTYENSVENMKNKIKKIQIAFSKDVKEEDLNFNGVFKIEKLGRVFTLITDDYGDEFIKKINTLNPLFIEEIDLSLEDVFIYKLDKEADYE